MTARLSTVLFFVKMLVGFSPATLDLIEKVCTKFKDFTPDAIDAYLDYVVAAVHWVRDHGAESIVLVEGIIAFFDKATVNLPPVPAPKVSAELPKSAGV